MEQGRGDLTSTQAKPSTPVKKKFSGRQGKLLDWWRVSKTFVIYMAANTMEANAICREDGLNIPHGDSVIATVCAVATKAASVYQTKEQLEGAV